MTETTINSELGKDTLDDKSDMDLLNSEDTTTQDDKDKIDKGKAAEEDEPDKDDLDILDEEDDKEDKEENELKDEDKTNDKVDEDAGTRLRPSIKDIIKKVPEAEKVFKAYPQLRDAYYREGKLTELFPTLEVAQESYDKAEALDVFDEAIRSGSSRELLEAVGKEDKKTLKTFVTSFLPTLQDMDEDLFYDVSIPVVNAVIRNLFATGEKLGEKEGQNMMAAAKILSKHLHGSYDIPEAEKKVDPELEAERKKFNAERDRENSEKYNAFEASVNDRTERILSKRIEDGLDPDKSLSEFTKSKIIDEVIKRVGRELSTDRGHMNSIGRLWKSAQNERFSDKSADRIITAFLSRAKQLIPEIRSKVKMEALGTKKREERGIGRTTRRETTPGRSSESRVNTTNPKQIDWRKKSDLDILNDK